jgi:hypothetical protein
VEKVAILREETIEHLMDRLSEERRKTMDRLSEERRKTLEDLLSEDERIKNLLKEMRQTLTEGNRVLLSLNDVSNTLRSGRIPGESKPTDIKDVKETLAAAKNTARELSVLVSSANTLLASPGLESFLSRLPEVAALFEEESKAVVDHTFRQTMLIVIIWLVGYVFARLIYRFLSVRLFKSDASGSTAGNVRS